MGDYLLQELQKGNLPEVAGCSAIFEAIEATKAADRAMNEALPKVAAALRDGGMLAIFDGGHIAGGTDEFFHEAQRCYEAHMPGTPPGLRPEHPDEVPLEFDLATQSGLFEIVALRRYVWLRDFTTQTYIDEISTYSGHIALSPDDRASLLACVSELLERGYGGAITKAYLTDLKLARKKG